MVRDAEPGDVVLIGINSYTVIDYNPLRKLAALSIGNKWRFVKLRKCFWVRRSRYSVSYKRAQLFKTFGEQWWKNVEIDKVFVI